MELPIDKLILGDCYEEMNELPAGSVDLIFADPPYNLQLQGELWRPNMSKVDAVDDEWDSFASFDDYDQFTYNWLSACRRLLDENGTIWVIGTYHNAHRVGRIMMDLGYWILNDVVWIKTNPMPNFRGVRFTNAHETLIWAKRSRTQRKYTFNYHAMKAINGGKQMRSDWRLPICSGKERLRDQRGKLHSTQKPEELLERVIRSSTNPGDIILDPFLGSGTTAAVAKRLGRHWIGIEKELEYIEIAAKRLKNVQAGLDIDDLAEPEKPPRVPFKRLVEERYLSEGETVYLDRDQSRRAVVMPDGQISTGALVGSIHRVGAQLAGWPTCNGWTHWFICDDHGNYRNLDTLRTEFLARKAGSA